MWKNSDEFLLLSVWMLYVISELRPEMRIQARKTDIQKGGNENGTLFTSIPSAWEKLCKIDVYSTWPIVIMRVDFQHNRAEGS